ncbi:P2Y purinoceptor 13-like [Hypomesus transpacificus]|uniref:P2Y purinoceptor 13-like n=1 Tax=Hypomesus transpacificus TaxID=137520 RepID=UPI001F0759C1|nr:P2Y purinoceptor 13-like [Hypomesus transpacificus]XP_046871196.1 P2Y purinoceptor 13-like [Hypomesus transpacificus]
MASSSPVLDCGLDEFTTHMVLSSLLFLLFVPATALNSVAAWVCLHLRSSSTFMVYLKNLVVADLLMTLTLPLSATALLPGCPVALRAFTCRVSDPVFYCCMYMSVILLGLISLDRFFKVVRPRGRRPCQSLTLSKTISASAWLFFITSNILPTIVLTNQVPVNGSRDLCMKMKSPTGKALHQKVVSINNAIFWCVSVLIGVCYVCIARKVFQSYKNSGSNNDEGNRRVKVRVFVVVMVFLLCFVPYHVLRILYMKLRADKPSCLKTKLRFAKKFSVWLAMTNVCLDPLIYFFLCKPFRNKLREMIRIGDWTNSQSSTNNDEATV